MARHLNIILTIFVAFIACSNPTIEDKSSLSSSGAAKTELMPQKNTSSFDGHENKIQTDSLPIHGELNQIQIEKYYPKILDSIKDIRIIGAEQLDVQTASGIHVSMLYNTGTFNQMFLCTHDKNFNLLDSYYVSIPKNSTV
jgi:Ser-tRNA(Ala) deacylase AlaX